MQNRRAPRRHGSSANKKREKEKTRTRAHMTANKQIATMMMMITTRKTREWEWEILTIGGYWICKGSHISFNLYLDIIRIEMKCKTTTISMGFCLLLFFLSLLEPDLCVHILLFFLLVQFSPLCLVLFSAFFRTFQQCWLLNLQFGKKELCASVCAD